MKRCSKSKDSRFNFNSNMVRTKKSKQGTDDINSSKIQKKITCFTKCTVLEVDHSDMVSEKVEEPNIATNSLQGATHTRETRDSAEASTSYYEIYKEKQGIVTEAGIACCAIIQETVTEATASSATSSDIACHEIIQETVTEATTSAATSSEIAEPCRSVASVWYKGEKLDINWLLKRHSCLKKYVKTSGKCNRPYISCTTCRAYEADAAKLSRNGIVPMAYGIQVESKQKLERVVDHLQSKAHKAAFVAAESAVL
jgi:hypothetical protein